MRQPGTIFLSVALLGAAVLDAPLAAAERAQSAWSLIEGVRASLAADGRLQADFTQTYTPAGFSAGESESGRLALALPDCLRWDYIGPEGKSFLLCGRDAYSWNAGDTEGRHQKVESRDEPGLDLLLLPLDHLRQRYSTSTKPTTRRRIEKHAGVVRSAVADRMCGGDRAGRGDGLCRTLGRDSDVPAAHRRLTVHSPGAPVARRLTSWRRQLSTPDRGAHSCGRLTHGAHSCGRLRILGHSWPTTTHSTSSRSWTSRK